MVVAVCHQQEEEKRRASSGSGAMAELPCDVDGKCMMCDQPPAPEELVCCNSCGSDWHAACLANAPEEPDVWQCPDCEPAAASGPCIPHQAAAPSDIVSKIRAIQDDASLSEREKARLRQDVLSGGRKEEKGKPGKSKSNGTLDILTDNLRCTMCLELCDRPVTTPCGHSSCLRCFQKYIAQGNKKCDKCRATIPPRMASEPRINAQMVLAIRMAKNGEQSAAQRPVSKPSAAVLENEKRPDKAFRSERAVKSGKANACSGRVFVKVPRDHLGPILAEHMADGEQAAFVGQSWEDRMECRQYGVHLPHVAGIAGRADFGAQSVALSGGYEDDEDHGDWFLYTGSGGRDLSGNKRTNKEQSFDQKFEKSNEALRESCRKGYPVRVVRSHKEKRSSYAPEMGVRYDGIYRIEMCWRKKGIQGFRVCRYLFVRCDNEPAPWASDEHGDRPRPLPIVAELKDATDITERKGSPFWDWHQESAQWGWSKPAPPSKSEGPPVLSEKRKRRETVAGEQKLLRQFGCGLCHKILELPLSTPCGHNFCKPCLEASCSSQEDTRQRGGARSSSLRVRKPVRRCPTCKTDISESYANLQVNRHLEDIIESIRKKQKTEDSSVADEDMSSDETEE